MSGVRVSVASHEIKEKDLKIYFSKPENGGGTIKAIYFPLFYNDAVILFENEHVAEFLMSQDHKIDDVDVDVSPLPLIQAFPILTAKVDSTALKILQSTAEILDEIIHFAGLDYNYDTEKNESTLTGNWYQLEWAWAKIEHFMHRQKHMERKSSHRMEVKERNTQLQKGNIPVKCDSIRPIISMPNTVEGEHKIGDSLKDDDDDDIVSSNDAKDVESRNKQRDSRQSHDNVNSALKPGSNTKEGELSLSKTTSESARQVSKITHQPITREKHVTFKAQGDLEASGIVSEERQKFVEIVNDRPDDMRSLEFVYGGLTVHICTGEITMVETEVIVNAAMGPLVNAGGVAKAISSASSSDMQRECDEYIRKHGSVPTSEVMHTCAGGRLSTKVKHILHAVGPVWSSNAYEDEARFLLTRTFLNCFNYANNRVQVSSMTLPVISSGIFGCPLEICIQAFMDAIFIFVEQHVKDQLCLKEITLINNNADTTALTVIQVRGLLTLDCKDLTKKALRFYNKNEDQKTSSRKRVDNKRGSDTSKSKTVTQKGTKDEASHQDTNNYQSSKTMGRPLPPVPKTEQGN